LTLPVAVGLKATSTVHSPPAAIELAQVPPTMMKGDETTMLVIETASVVEWLVTVTVFDPLVTPTFSPPNSSLPGENDSLGGLGALTFLSG
jgi:chorismate synthase